MYCVGLVVFWYLIVGLYWCWLILVVLIVELLLV